MLIKVICLKIAGMTRFEVRIGTVPPAQFLTMIAAFSAEANETQSK